MARTSSRQVSTLPMKSAWMVVTYSRISVSSGRLAPLRTR